MATDKPTVTCPTSRLAPDGTEHTVFGCGHTFDSHPDSEGLEDCPRCGIWFDPAQEVPTP